jgi:hypothetical protein
MTRTAGLAGQQQARPDQIAVCMSPDFVVARGVCLAAAECLSPIWVGSPWWSKFSLML